MDDYLDAATSEKGARWAFTSDGWFRTGDLGALRHATCCLLRIP